MASRLHPPLVATIAAAVLALAGCGGGGTDSNALYAPVKTRQCLLEAGLKLVPVSSGTDFVASTALNGALSAKLPLNEVTISFGRNRAEARRIARAYERFGRKTIPVSRVLQLERNVVLLWAGAPTPDDAVVVNDCLR
jgi:hypothetical protein